MSQFRNNINNFLSIYNMCENLSSIVKYKYVCYIEKSRYLEQMLGYINIYSLNYIKQRSNTYLLIIDTFSYDMLYKIINKYVSGIIICDTVTIRKMKPHINTKNIYIFDFNNRKIKEFNTNIYEGNMLIDIYNKMALINCESIDVYYRYTFINKYNNANGYMYDNNSSILCVNEIVVAVYLNKLIASICLVESQNLDEAMKNIQLQIKQEKRNYRNYRSRQDLFNLVKFYI